MSDAAPKPQSKLRENLKGLGAIALLCYGPFLFIRFLHFALHLLDVVPLMSGLTWPYFGAFVCAAVLSQVYYSAPKTRRAGLMLPASILATLICLGVGLAVNFKAVKVEGNSMQPYLQPGDVLLVDLTAGPDYRYGIYTLNLPDGEHAHVIKRLVGLPGEKMDVRYGRVFADDTEVYPRDGSASDTWNETRPANARFYSGPRDNGEKYFVLGDNPPDSRDSRHFGALEASAFEGRVVWSLRGSHGFGPVAFAYSE